jgi:hypothetical protein
MPFGSAPAWPRQGVEAIPAAALGAPWRRGPAGSGGAAAPGSVSFSPGDGVKEALARDTTLDIDGAAEPSPACPPDPVGVGPPPPPPPPPSPGPPRPLELGEPPKRAAPRAGAKAGRAARRRRVETDDRAPGRPAAGQGRSADRGGHADGGRGGRAGAELRTAGDLGRGDGGDLEGQHAEGQGGDQQAAGLAPVGFGRDDVAGEDRLADRHDDGDGHHLDADGHDIADRPLGQERGLGQNAERHGHQADQGDDVELDDRHHDVDPQHREGQDDADGGQGGDQDCVQVGEEAHAHAFRGKPADIF